MRKLLRSIARYNMQTAGIDRLNKPMRDGKGNRVSKFSCNWRKWIVPRMPRARRKRKSKA